jgi:signal transduction histidine kinase
VLEQQLDAAKLESRASEAEKSSLELKSQLYASIGIMAGSYAHNIKNLLVRPNDLLTRCIESNDATRDQQHMMQEVKTTLGTVTERLQQILRTVRRDPTNAEITRFDLAALIRESERMWAEMGRDKWKLGVAAEIADAPLWVSGDLSHLQQAIENLVFNARDATFEMRNYLRDEAKREPDPGMRKQKLLDAAAWRGEVHMRLRRDGDWAILEVRDNGIGMTEEVRRNCLKTHFTTKRDNALYEGYSAGMGLGLSFVAVVLEHHGAKLDIESAPLRGTTFQVRIPIAEKQT